MTLENRIDALNHHFQSHYGLVVAVARRYAPGSDAVDDIVQQAYLDFVGASTSDRWDLQGGAGAILFQITKRRALKVWEERQKRQTLPLAEVAGELQAGLEEKEKETYDILHDRIRALRNCIERLSPKSRAIIEQHYFNGVSMKEIGEKQNMKTSAIHQFFCRVRLKLRSCVEQTLELEQL